MPHTAAFRPRAHSAHAALLRLSAVALSAYAERELLEAFEEEARSALAADAVAVIATRAETSGLTATSEPTTLPAGIAQVAAGARTVALDEVQAATEAEFVVAEAIRGPT